MKILAKGGVLLGTAVIGSVLGIGITSIAFAGGGEPEIASEDATTSADSAASQPAPSAEERPVYEVNAAGQTYGSLAGVSDQANWPELLDTIGDDGKTQGYVLKSDFLGPEPGTPEEALKMNGPRTIPLYAKDGRTVIGSFTLEASSETVAPE